MSVKILQLKETGNQLKVAQGENRLRTLLGQRDEVRVSSQAPHRKGKAISIFSMSFHHPTCPCVSASFSSFLVTPSSWQNMATPYSGTAELWTDLPRKKINEPSTSPPWLDMTSGTSVVFRGPKRHGL